MIRVGVLVSGGGTNLQAIIDAVKNKTITNASLEVVISNKKDAYALTRAKENNIAAECVCVKDYETREEFNKALIEKIDSYNLDLIVLAGFLVVLPPELIAKYRNKIINVHPSLIPSFCGNGFYGLHVHEKALERGVKVTGATVHFVDEGTDTGPIIYQKAVEVLPDDTPETLQKRVMEQAEWKILPQAINAIANNLLQTQIYYTFRFTFIKKYISKAAGACFRDTLFVKRMGNKKRGVLNESSYCRKRRKRTCHCNSSSQKFKGGQNILCTGKCRHRTNRRMCKHWCNGI